jgi:restriction system protein
MAIPDYQSLMLPLLKRAAEGETRVPDVSEKLARDLGLTAAEQEQLLPSGRQTVLHNRIHWAKFYMTKAGLIDVPRRGRFVASEAGRALLAHHPEKISVEMLLESPSFREFYRGSAEGEESLEDSTPSRSPPDTNASRWAERSTPEEQIEAAYLAVQSALRAELLERTWQNSPSFFEQLIIDLLVAMGYGGSHRNAAAQLGKSGDGGVDGVVNEDRLGLDRVYVQAKRYASTVPVGRPEVQAFVGSLVGLGATKGVFVTTSSFSRQAIEFARHLTQRIILIDGNQLADLMVEHNVGVRTSRALEFKRLDEDFFTEDS